MMDGLKFDNLEIINKNISFKKRGNLIFRCRKGYITIEDNYNSQSIIVNGKKDTNLVEPYYYVRDSIQVLNIKETTKGVHVDFVDITTNEEFQITIWI